MICASTLIDEFLCNYSI